MAKFSRRDFLKGAALAAGAGAVAGLAGCSAPASSAGESGGSSADEISWDEEYDVVVDVYKRQPENVSLNRCAVRYLKCV